MPSKAQPVRIGPFTGGLNTYGDPAAVADEDAVDLINFEVDLDGSLKSRPAFSLEITGQNKFQNRILGIYSTLAGVHYVIFSSVNAADAPITCYYRLDTAATGIISNNFAATSIAQYQNKVWLVAPPTSASPGGSWDGTTFTAVASMAKGVSAAIYKERLFIATGYLDSTNPSRVFFSGAANPASWTGTDFFDVNNGDGQSIWKIHSYSGSIVIFKTRSTYVYAYESSPTKGQVQIVNSTMGLDGPDCMVEAEAILYVKSGGDIYTISNWSWEQINVKVPFEYVNAHTGNTSSDASLSVFGNRVICRYFDTYYVYGIKTKTWTKWFSSRTPDIFIKSPVDDPTTGVEIYYAGNYLNHSAGVTSDSLFRAKDTHTVTDSETFTCTVRSKVYSMDVPYSFKRLMWWGIDMLSKSKVDVTVIPVTYALPVRFSDLAGKTFADLVASGSTFGRPLDVNINVTDSADIKNTGGVRIFIKYLKSLRFRQVQFVVSSTVDGTTATGPLQIYSMTAFVINKQLVTKKIN